VLVAVAVLDLRALCAPRAPCTRGLGLETTGRALALALSLPASRQLHCPCRSGSAVALHCAARAAAPFCLCRSVRTIPVRWSSVLTTRRRHSRVIFPPLLVCAQFLFVFLFATTWTPSVLTSRPPACVVANDAPSG